jgi:aminoglycoside 6'-N-acetyltransferase
MEIGFRPVTAGDLPLLRTWIARPHLRRWWGEPEEEVAAIAAGLGDPGFEPFIILIDGREAGYIQSWVPDGSWEIPVEAPPATTRGIDLSLAEATNCGRGIGRRVIDAFVRRLAAEGVRRVVIDPHPENARARRAYRAAGFVEAARGVHCEGPYVLMVRDIIEKVEA